MPNTYSQIIINSDTTMPVIFDSFKTDDIWGAENAINIGSDPISYFPLQFESGYILVTKSSACKIKVREFILTQ